jgi:hypothetical protein
LKSKVPEKNKTRNNQCEKERYRVGEKTNRSGLRLLEAKQKKETRNLGERSEKQDFLKPSLRWRWR